MLEIDVGGKIVKIQDDYVPTDGDGEYMCEKHRAYFKHKLQVWLDEIQEKIKVESINDVNSDYRSVDESDLMSMEGIVVTELRSKDRLRKLAIKIKEFINKIDADTYGFCEESGEEIGINRLIARPIARFCINVQERKDREENEREFIERNQEEQDSKR